jgi:DNA repair protein RadC
MIALAFSLTAILKISRGCTIELFPSDVADYMIPTMKDLTQEHFVILLLNSKNVVIKETCVFKGTLNSSNYELR